MGIVSFDEERSSKVAPARLFKALVTVNHNLLPKIRPMFIIIKSTIIEGDGGVGSIIRLLLYDDTEFLAKYTIKYKIDILDETQFIGKYTIIEGRYLNEVVKSLSFETKLEPTTNGGCLIKLKMVFTIADGAELSQEELGGYKKKGKIIFDDIEGYLLQNPDVYA